MNRYSPITYTPAGGTIPAFMVKEPEGDFVAYEDVRQLIEKCEIHRQAIRDRDSTAAALTFLEIDSILSKA